jgi:hypothetical protein
MPVLVINTTNMQSTNKVGITETSLWSLKTSSYTCKIQGNWKFVNNQWYLDLKVLPVAATKMIQVLQSTRCQTKHFAGDVIQTLVFSYLNRWKDYEVKMKKNCICDVQHDDHIEKLRKYITLPPVSCIKWSGPEYSFLTRQCRIEIDWDWWWC